MPTTCNITFDNNPQKVCYSGTLLQGSVFLTLTNSKSVRGLFIKIKGDAHARWSEGSGKNKRTYTGEETYLNERTYFAGGANADIVVQPGSYTYTFQCQLPPNLPTSMEGNYGWIRYSACVVFDIPLWPDKEFEEAFTVIKPIDLNAIPSLREPQTMVKNKTFYPCFLMCCCVSDPLEMSVRMPVGGYTPGQTINLDIEARNKSDQDVEGFTAQLLKHITYHTYAGSSKRKEETVLITDNATDGCLQARNIGYKVNLEVPPIPPTDDTTSNICKVSYAIRVYGSVACCHSDPTISMPVVIGSVPILDTEPPAGSAPMYNTVITSQPTGPDATAPLLSSGQIPMLPYPPAGVGVVPPVPQANAPSAPMFNDIDPPTYEEATMADGTDSKDKTNKKFNPKYPMFRRNTSYSSNN